jgi:hypothetical protein
MGRESGSGELVDYFLHRWNLDGTPESDNGFPMRGVMHARKVFKLNVASGKWSRLVIVKRVTRVSFRGNQRTETIVKEWKAE